MSGTRRFLVDVVAGALVVALAACAGYSGAGLQPGASDAEVRASMGPPQRVWRDPGGGSSWEYARGPEGKQTYMVRLGPDGRLLRIDQVLSEPFFEQLRAGMAVDEVERILGRPYDVQRFARVGETVWAWRWERANVWRMCFYAHFDDGGRLVRTSAREEDASDDFPRRRPC